MDDLLDKQLTLTQETRMLMSRLSQWGSGFTSVSDDLKFKLLEVLNAVNDEIDNGSVPINLAAPLTPERQRVLDDILVAHGVGPGVQIDG